MLVYSPPWPSISRSLQRHTQTCMGRHSSIHVPVQYSIRVQYISVEEGAAVRWEGSRKGDQPLKGTAVDLLLLFSTRYLKSTMPIYFGRAANPPVRNLRQPTVGVVGASTQTSGRTVKKARHQQFSTKWSFHGNEIRRANTMKREVYRGCFRTSLAVLV